MYSSGLTPGDPYSFSAGHTPTPTPDTYLYSAGHTPDPTAFGAVQTPPAAFGAVQTDQTEFGAGKIPDHTAIGAVQTSNPTPDQTAIRYTAGFSATSFTPPTAFGAVQTGQTAFGASKIPDYTSLGDFQTKNPTPDQTAIRYTAGFSATSSTPPQAPGFSWLEFIEIKFQELTGLVESKFEELSNKIEDVRRGEERKENDEAEGNTDLIKAGVFILSNSVSPPHSFKRNKFL